MNNKISNFKYKMTFGNANDMHNTQIQSEKSKDDILKKVGNF